MTKIFPKDTPLPPNNQHKTLCREHGNSPFKTNKINKKGSRDGLPFLAGFNLRNYHFMLLLAAGASNIGASHSLFGEKLFSLIKMPVGLFRFPLAIE